MLRTNSKCVSPGDIFVALRGVDHDGMIILKMRFKEEQVKSSLNTGYILSIPLLLKIHMLI